MYFIHVRPIGAYIRHERGGKGVYLVQRCSPIHTGESRSGRDVAKVVVFLLRASIVPEIEKQAAPRTHVVVQPPQFVVKGVGARILVQIVLVSDRKSTRLNSSHLVISY